MCLIGWVKSRRVRFNAKFCIKSPLPPRFFTLWSRVCGCIKPGARSFLHQSLTLSLQDIYCSWIVSFLISDFWLKCGSGMFNLFYSKLCHIQLILILYLSCLGNVISWCCVWSCCCLAGGLLPWPTADGRRRPTPPNRTWIVHFSLAASPLPTCLV